MKHIGLAVLAGALAISTMAVAIDDASAAARSGVHRSGVHRGGVKHVGTGRVGVARAGYRSGWNGYYGRGLGVATGIALGTAAAAASYGNADYAEGAYASAAPAVGWENGNIGNTNAGYPGGASAGYGAGYISGSYYGPICSPGFNMHCQ